MLYRRKPGMKPGSKKKKLKPEAEKRKLSFVKHVSLTEAEAAIIEAAYEASGLRFRTHFTVEALLFYAEKYAVNKNDKNNDGGIG